MSVPCKAYLGLGANLGDPVQQIVDARECLSALDGTVSVQCSSLYLSSPVGYSEQANFVNCVLELSTRSSMMTFFEEIQKIESRLGRKRDKRNQNAPRTIDIDLLLFGEQTHSTPGLTVPHPRLTQRLFVLEPLSELLLDGTHPVLGDVSEIIQAGEFTGQELFRLAC